MTFPPEAIRHFQILDEIERQTDRGAALVATAYLDERLRDALRAMCTDDVQSVKDGSDTVESRLFDGTGPFATLSAKINAAFALGFVGPISLRELHLIRKIRNHFAHSSSPGGFDASPVADWCRELRLPEWCLDFGDTEPPSEPRQRFLRSVDLLWSFLFTEMVKKDLVGVRRVPPSPDTLP